MKRFLAFLAAALLATAAAARPRSGVLSTSFDGKPSGARFIGQGETGAAAIGGPESPIWNPAALHDLPRSIFSADFDVARQSKIDEGTLLGDVPLRGRKLTYLGFAAPDAAFFFRPLANFNVKSTTSASDPANNFTEENFKVNQIGFSASQEGDHGATVGLNISYLNAHRSLAVIVSSRPPVIEFADGHGFAVDLGFRKKGDTGAVGVSLHNLPGLLYWNRYKPDRLPMIVRAGVAFYPIPRFGVLADYEKRYYRNLPKPDFLHLGMEMTLLPWVQIRGGAYGEDLNDVDKTFYTGGFSVISNRGHQVDFALRTFRFLGERVHNYFLSILLPLPDGSREEKPPVRFQGKGLDQF